MRVRDETPLDPKVVASLDAIDSVLAGEPVDPRYADLAEVTLLVAAERPEPDTAFATLLDDRVERRFATARPAARKPGRSRRRWLWGPVAGVSIAAVVAVLVVVSPGPSVPTPPVLHGAASSSGAAAPAASAPSRAAGSGASAPAFGGQTRAPAPPSALQPAVGAMPPLGSATTPSQAGSATTTSQAGSVASPPAVLQPPANGRKLIQGGQLALTTSPGRIDTVAQEVFNVVGQERGIVNRSTVTATGGPGGYAEFELSIPSGVLAQTMAALSTLPYAHVTSRTDTSQDVTNQYNGDVTALADARALRTSLLKQLANATTQAQIDSLTAQLHDAEASISSDLATLRGLNNQVNYSQVTVTINGGPLPVTPQSGSGGFTLHRAAHDAGRVLTVAAGAALIGAAALLPLAMLGALGWWVVAAIRRRRREHALDMA